MDAAHKIRPKGAMHSAVTLHPAHRAKGCGADCHVEMRLATFAPTPMATVFFAIIVNCKGRRCKTCRESREYFVFYWHFIGVAPFNPACFRI